MIKNVFFIIIFIFYGCSQIFTNKIAVKNVNIYWECESVNVYPLDFYFEYNWGNIFIENNSKDTILLETVSTPFNYRSLLFHMELDRDTLTFRTLLKGEDAFLEIVPSDTMLLKIGLETFNFSLLDVDSLKRKNNYVHGKKTSKRIQKIINHGKLFYFRQKSSQVSGKHKRQFNDFYIPKRSKLDTCVITIPREY